VNIHEYQAKSILRDFEVPVVKGIVVLSPEEAVAAAKGLGGKRWVVKAQIHAGGRGKGGGVKLVTSLDDVRAETDRMLGMNLVTHQTGAEGKQVRRIYIERASEIARELYLSCLVDRQTSRVAFICSTEGGVDIEQVAAQTPEKIVTLGIDPSSGFSSFHGRRIAFALGLEGKQVKQCVALIANLYRGFLDKDASLIEINPLVVTGAGDLLCLDAKMNFDDNALYRHTDIADLRDIDEEDPAEVEASRFDLSYVKLDGNIGCMVNGAGLAMATMDIIKLYGAAPANFLDVGGGANREQVINAFKIILSDPNVEGILVNIFGGIMRCDIIAEGIVEAAKEISIGVPLVVRLEGTNVTLGKKILNDSGLAIIAADDLADAAKKIVAHVEG
jgi:succinyl-CoA synthetase beta subunit